MLSLSRNITIVIYSVFTSTVIITMTTPLFKGVNEDSLPLQGCFYFTESYLLFWLVHFYQGIALGLCCITTAAHDSLFSILAVQVNAQVDLLKSRLNELSNDKDLNRKLNGFRNFVKQHNRLLM